jgi:hypothetical protein
MGGRLVSVVVITVAVVGRRRGMEERSHVNNGHSSVHPSTRGITNLKAFPSLAVVALTLEIASCIVHIVIIAHSL